MTSKWPSRYCCASLYHLFVVFATLLGSGSSFVAAQAVVVVTDLAEVAEAGPDNTTRDSSNTAENSPRSQPATVGLRARQQGNSISPKPPMPLPVSVSGPRPSRDAQTVLVVSPPTLLPTLSPWIEYRQQQGYRIVHIDGRLSNLEILTTIRRFARAQRVHYVVIVGDGDVNMNLDANLRRVCVPTFIVASEINSELGVEPHIATDNPYGDLDGDHVPDIPVGRMSVKSPKQLERMIRKIIDYEQTPRGGEWRRNVQIAAGVGDFGMVADTIIETAAKKLMADGIPPEYRTTVTYGNWRSPFCPDPRLFREHMLLQLEKGCLFWVYMGHGRAHRLDRFQVRNLIIPVLESSDVPRVRPAHGLPIAVLLACYTGAFDQPIDCLAEELVRSPQGPIAALASSRVAMPYSMSILGTSLMNAAFEPSKSQNPKQSKSYAVLGDLILKGRRGLASESGGGTNRKLMDSLAKTLSPTKEKLPLERREHQMMFNLLGDPLLRIEQPKRIQVAAPERIQAGKRIQIQGTSPIHGQCTIELVCRRDRLTFDHPRRRNLAGGNETLMGMNETYNRANDSRWYQREVPVKPGRFTVMLDVPAESKGPSHIRMRIEGDDDFAIGATDVYIQPPGGKSDLRTSNAER